MRITGDGAWILFVNEQGEPTPNSSEGWVLDGASGALRGNYTIPFFITAAISDSGEFVVRRETTSPTVRRPLADAHCP